MVNDALMPTEVVVVLLAFTLVRPDPEVFLIFIKDDDALAA
jgi:hypothetical protein